MSDRCVASGIVREHGKTAMDALYKLGYMYPLLHVHIAEHFDEVMKQFGPKTDAEKVELLRRVFG